MIDEIIIEEFLRIQDNGRLYHREGQSLEFKEQFNLAGLGDYFRDFAAFANNKGGYLIFGVTDSPRTASGMSQKSLDSFEKIDPEKISGFLLDLFSGNIEWEQAVAEIDNKRFGVFKISEASIKPLIAKKDEGKANVIKSGEVYFRYGGRTQKIRYPELEAIINKRIEFNNSSWLDLMSKIGKAGPQNAAILNTEKALIEKGDRRIMVIDEELAGKLDFIKEGEFKEKKGAKTLKLVGDITPIDKVEVIKKVKENLLKRFPLSATQVVKKVKELCPDCKQNRIYDIIKENNLKDNFNYSAYNFRTKERADIYQNTGTVPRGTTSIYNQNAIDFITNIIKQQEK